MARKAHGGIYWNTRLNQSRTLSSPVATTRMPECIRRFPLPVTMVSSTRFVATALVCLVMWFFIACGLNHGNESQRSRRWLRPDVDRRKSVGNVSTGWNSNRLHWCMRDCNLCKYRYIIILGTGRSGSTTVLSMLNLVPEVHISGENAGQILSFVDLSQRIEATNKHVGIDSWLREPISRESFLCYVQSWLLHSTRMPCDDPNIKFFGWKEIRYTDEVTLRLIAEIFPCSKIILNFRRNVAQQARSGWFESSQNATDVLARQNNVLLQFHERHQTAKRAERDGSSESEVDTFIFPLEDFTVDGFNRLLDWLGIFHCRFKATMHVNKGGYEEGFLNARGDGVIECLKTDNTNDYY